MLEEWKPVEHFEGLYEVSNLGNVRSLRSGALRKPVVNKSTGYAAVVLCGSTYKQTLTVHRLVAKAFVENPNSYDFVNHIDENKLNNNAWNLEWCTKAYNNTYNGKTQRCCKKVAQINPETGEQVIWPSAKAASRMNIANYKNISACCRGKRNKAGGYKWRFVNE